MGIKRREGPRLLMWASSSHCWVCDDHGELYIVTDINESHSQSPESPNAGEVKLKWTKVDSGFRNIYTGYDGLVCAIKESSLWVRKGVTSDRPMGDDWIRYMCDILKVMAGRTYIVRKSAKGKLHTARINQKEPEVLLDWKYIPAIHEQQDKDEDEAFHYHAVDGRDRLFSVTESGMVSCCDMLSEEDLYWTLVTGPPKMDKGLVGWISSKLWTSSSSNSSTSKSSSSSSSSSSNDWVGAVSFGLDSLWCLKEGSNEVWQLVIGQLNDTLRVNWVRSELPHLDGEETVSLAACKSTKDGLYLIVKEQGHHRIVSYSLNKKGEDSGRTEIALPTRYSCKCIAISSISSKTSECTAIPSVTSEKYVEEVHNKVADD